MILTDLFALLALASMGSFCLALCLEHGKRGRDWVAILGMSSFTCVALWLTSYLLVRLSGAG
jgi:hypothetical protein